MSNATSVAAHQELNSAELGTTFQDMFERSRAAPPGWVEIATIRGQTHNARVVRAADPYALVEEVRAVGGGGSTATATSRTR